MHVAVRVQRVRSAEQRSQSAAYAWAVEHFAELRYGRVDVVSQAASRAPAIKKFFAMLMNQLVRVAELIVDVQNQKTGGDELPHLGVSQQLGGW